MWRQTQKFLAAFVPALLLVIYFVVVACMLNRWDSMVPITLIPVWAWGAMGTIVSLIGWIVFRGKAILYIFCLWLFSGIVFSEEARSIALELAAAVKQQPESDEKVPSKNETLRVVNFNANGKAGALTLLMDLEPGIIAIQQAPDEDSLTAIADQLFGVDRAVVTNGSNAILARGEFLATLSEPDSNTIHARLRTPTGTIVDITNLHLEPCLPSLGMWRPGTWEKLIAARLENRKLVRAYLGENEITSGKTGRIVCGGFATPPGDDVFRPLATAGLIDSFDAAGMGWGNTYSDDYAILRTDQIWISESLIPTEVTTRRAAGSEHRTVVCDIEIKKP